MMDGKEVKTPGKQDRTRKGFPSVAHQFKPGQSGNPSGLPGRPKSASLTRRLADILARETFGGKALPDSKCVADVLAEVIVKEALKGKFVFAKELLERIDGKVPDRIIDETPDADSERERSEFDSLVAALRERGRGPSPEKAGRKAIAGRNGDGHERGEMDADGPPGTAE